MRTAISPHKAVRRRLRHSVMVAISMVAAILVSLAGPAQATDISIPFDDLIFGAPGSVASIAVVNVDADMVSLTCNLVVLAKNQSSVHPGNDLIVSTGTSQAVIFGVEDTANGGTSETYEMVLGPTISVELRIGKDGMSSLGFDLSFDCVPAAVEPAAPAIGEQIVTSTSTTSTSTPPSSTTTTAAAGCTTASGANGVNVGDDCCESTTATSTTATTVAGSTAAATTDCCSTDAGVSNASSTSSTSSTSTGTDCCTQIIGTAATGCAAAAAPSTTTTTPPATTTAAPATVAGAATSQLPETPAARAVAGSPSYTG